MYTLIMHLIGRTVTCLWCLVIFGASGETFSSNKDDRPCRSDSVINFHQCEQNETCVSLDGTAFCRCKKDFERKEGSCQPVPTEPSPSPFPSTSKTTNSGGFGFKLVLWLLIPILLAGAIGVIVYTGRQKMWLNRLYRMRIRSYNNVLVSSQDEDDPPIA